MIKSQDGYLCPYKQQRKDKNNEKCLHCLGKTVESKIEYGL